MSNESEKPEQTDGLSSPERKETGLDNWLLTKEACSMSYRIYERLLHAIGTFLMAVKLPESQSVVGWTNLSDEQAEELGVTEYRVNKYDQKWAAEDTEGHWNNAYDIQAKLEELFQKGYRIANYGDSSHTNYDWDKYEEQVHDWYVETAPFVQFLWI